MIDALRSEVSVDLEDRYRMEAVQEILHDVTWQHRASNLSDSGSLFTMVKAATRLVERRGIPPVFT
jgi:hypothetical protein